MYAAIAVRTLLWEHGWFWGEKPGRFKLVEAKISALGIGINIEISAF